MLIKNQIKEITCRPNNKKILEDKGYKWKYNELIKIKVEDLSNGSAIYINVRCDNCLKILENIRYCDYLKQVKEDGKYYCRKCGHKLFAGENLRKTKLKNSLSFEKWCVNNNRQDVLDRWDYELNENIKPSEINYKTGKKYYFKCPRGLHESELKNIKDFTNGHEGSIKCKKCNSFVQWGIDNLGKDFIEKYWDYEKNTVDPWEISYSSDKKIYIICQEKDYHGSYPMRCADFTKGQRCPYCSNRNGKIHPLDSLGTLYPEVLKIWSDKNKKSPYKYAPHSGEYVYWKCHEGKHEDYYRKIHDSNDADFRCPECVKENNESILQGKVRKYIESLNYTIKHENKCTLIPINPKLKGTNNTLPYDNEIKELKLIIEVHGIQHYKITNFHKLTAKRKNTTPEYELHMQKVRDRYKRMYAKSKINNYHYLEIPYWTDDNEETWKNLIDNKINEITNIKYIEQQNKSA